ncbi:hypothetical protein LIZ98_17505 [Caldibacillus sp. 210928-DFI.2.18]|uniref:hypothetical protein n=1 Tax=unclassified Caldibacillus TaxID=2641266 RepID=UPI001D07A810|nr:MULTISPECIES: hypothetical protein [unclassified Caldibacillus]MCB7075155.1 hypothetical protein [Caldibacillus sp. 210928-DFI.2.18]
MTTRKSLVAKKWTFSHKNDDENGSRHQKMEFPVKKRRRERVSSSKLCSFHFKMVTRLSLVAKIERFSLQNDDEIEFRRQNCGVFTSKW